MRMFPVTAAALTQIALATALTFPAFAASIELPPKTLEVCADPTNLPYSNDHEQGFENAIAKVIGADMHLGVHTVWNMQRRSFFRHTLLAGICDVVISVPSSLPIVATTRPYFTSSYVFVTRRRDDLHLTSFDDPRLRDARIGLQLLGADGANPPPAMALARRGITDHVTGFAMWANDDVADPQGQIVGAVASGQIDVAIIWGPFGGYFAKPFGDALRVDPITVDPRSPGLAFTYAMSVGVRKTDTALRDRVQVALDRHRPEIDAILRGFGIPLVTPAASTATQ
jgi:mxaJ protein